MPLTFSVLTPLPPVSSMDSSHGLPSINARRLLISLSLFLWWLFAHVLAFKRQDCVAGVPTFQRLTTR